MKAQYQPRAPPSTAHTCVLESINRKCYKLFYGKGGKLCGLKLGEKLLEKRKISIIKHRDQENLSDVLWIGV